MKLQNCWAGLPSVVHRAMNNKMVTAAPNGPSSLGKEGKGTRWFPGFPPSQWQCLAAVTRRQIEPSTWRWQSFTEENSFVAGKIVVQSTFRRARRWGREEGPGDGGGVGDKSWGDEARGGEDGGGLFYSTQECTQQGQLQVSYFSPTGLVLMDHRWWIKVCILTVLYNLI